MLNYHDVTPNALASRRFNDSTSYGCREPNRASGIVGLRATGVGQGESRPTDSGHDVVGRATLSGAAMADYWVSIGHCQRPRL
jgi:hypothetical protein